MIKLIFNAFASDNCLDPMVLLDGEDVTSDTMSLEILPGGRARITRLEKGADGKYFVRHWQEERHGDVLHLFDQRGEIGRKVIEDRYVVDMPDSWVRAQAADRMLKVMEEEREAQRSGQ